MKLKIWEMMCPQAKFFAKPCIASCIPRGLKADAGAQVPQQSKDPVSKMSANQRTQESLVSVKWLVVQTTGVGDS